VSGRHLPDFDCIGQYLHYRETSRRVSEPPELPGSRLHLAQIARLLLAFLVVAGEAQSKQTVPIVEPFEGSLPGTELSVVKFYKPVDVNVDFNKEFSQPRSAPSGLLLPADFSRDEYAYSTGATTVADIPKNDLPSAPIRIDLTPLLVHLAQAAENPHAAPSVDGEEEHYQWKGLLLQSLGLSR
jgi:hypothetical protein